VTVVMVVSTQSPCIRSAIAAMRHSGHPSH
jgi:hypothetical protein